MNQRPLDKLEGLHLATNQPVEIVLTPTESRLAQGKTNEEWDALCVSIEMRTGHIIQGQIQVCGSIQLSRLSLNWWTRSYTTIRR
jgi:hypothetical protein